MKRTVKDDKEKLHVFDENGGVDNAGFKGIAKSKGTVRKIL